MRGLRRAAVGVQPGSELLRPLDQRRPASGGLAAPLTARRNGAWSPACGVAPKILLMTAPRASATVIVFSHDPAVREQVRTAVGRRPAPDLGRIDWVECAPGEEVVARVDAGGVDVAILDAEAQPAGGMGISRQLKNEVDDVPALLLLLARRDDRWLATWSLADATLAQPLDPVAAAETVAQLLRDRARRLPVVR